MYQKFHNLYFTRVLKVIGNPCLSICWDRRGWKVIGTWLLVFKTAPSTSKVNNQKELTSKVVGSIPGHGSKFSYPNYIKINKSPSVRVIMICCDHRLLWQDSYKGVDHVSLYCTRLLVLFDPGPNRTIFSLGPTHLGLLTGYSSMGATSGPKAKGIQAGQILEYQLSSEAFEIDFSEVCLWRVIHQLDSWPIPSVLLTCR